MSILIKPIITEKATNDSELNNRYAFVVDKRANKLEIKGAVEAAYGVAITAVRTMNYPVQRNTKFTKERFGNRYERCYTKSNRSVSRRRNIDFYNNL